MPEILCYSRNICNSVEQIDDATIFSSCRLQNTLMDGFVETRFRLPDLEIVGIKGEIRRPAIREEINVSEVLQKVIGVRVGPGMKKIIKGLIGEFEMARELAFLVAECCEGIILSFTKDVLLGVPKDRAKEREYFENMVRDNPRLYNSCAALASGSPLVEGIEPAAPQSSNE